MACAPPRIPLLLAVAACGAPPRYLGAPLPGACATRDAEACAGWMAEQDLGAGGLDVYSDPALRVYVQGIADRLARGSHLSRSPRVVISDHDGTYAAFGDRIVIGRVAIEKLGSEAELAAIVAHELVHVEGRHATVSLFGPDDASWLAARRDAEGIADERAVALLERAGYAPAAMTRALEAELPDDDDDDPATRDHPPRGERLAHVARLAGGRIDGFDGRAELMAHVDRMIVGRDTRLGIRVDDAWVIAVLGVALDLPPRDIVHVDGDAVVLRHGRSSLTAYPIGAPWARELAATLDARAQTESALGRITVGTAAAHATGTAPLDRLERAVQELLPQPAPGTQVVVLDRPRGGLVLELAPRTDPIVRDRWLAGLRAASPAELAAAEPRRIAIARAPHAGTVAELAAMCPDPDAARRLDRADRVLGAGDPIKCTDRWREHDPVDLVALGADEQHAIGAERDVILEQLPARRGGLDARRLVAGLDLGDEQLAARFDEIIGAQLHHHRCTVDERRPRDARLPLDDRVARLFEQAGGAILARPRPFGPAASTSRSAPRAQARREPQRQHGGRDRDDDQLHGSDCRATV
jgi:hypothetical protein